MSSSSSMMCGEEGGRGKGGERRSWLEVEMRFRGESSFGSVWGAIFAGIAWGRRHDRSILQLNWSPTRL